MPYECAPNGLSLNGRERRSPACLVEWIKIWCSARAVSRTNSRPEVLFGEDQAPDPVLSKTATNSIVVVKIDPRFISLRVVNVL